MARVPLTSTFSLSSFSSSTLFSSFKNTNLGFWDEKTCLLPCNAKKKPNFVDQILDYIEGGPKLRKWYGAPDILPKDPSVEEDEDNADGVRDTILVTDGYSDIGQMVILALIFKRTPVKVLVNDKRAAMEAFGNYIEALVGDTSNKKFMKKALRGIRAVICPNEGFLSKVGSLRGVQHVVLLSQLSVYKAAGGIQALMKANAKRLAEEDESVLLASGIPYTIIRAGSLQNSPGGIDGFCFEEGCAAKGSLSKEDAALICVEALDIVPQSGVILEVINGVERVSDWKEHFTKLMEKA